jgi:hypothetical protein
MFYFRYLDSAPIKVGQVTLNPRQIYYALYKAKAFCLGLDGQLVPTPIKEDVLQSILAKSRPMTNMPTLPTLTTERIKQESLSEATPDNKADSPALPVMPKSVIPANAPSERLKLSVPKKINNRPIVGKTSVPIPIQMLPNPTRFRSKSGKTALIYPIQPDILDMVTEALKHTGSIVPYKGSRLYLAESFDYATMISIITQANQMRSKSFLIINRGQLTQINGGVLDTKIVAQAITHELAHYMWYSGIVKQTDVTKFKRMYSENKELHPDQFEHPGYSNPWSSEAWAVLCEYMVHGTSARGLVTPLGWEIAQEYFQNNYLKNGKPSNK